MRGTLFSRLCEPKTLWQAWNKIKQKGAVRGIDNVSIEVFEKYLDRNLRRISDSLLDGTYAPEPTKRAYIWKEKPGERRKIALPAIKDKIVQEATRSILDSLFDRTFADTSYAYRLSKGAQRAIARVEHHCSQGRLWAATGDIDNFFDSIDHDLLLRLLSKKIWEKEIIRLIELWLKMGVIVSDQWQDVETGVPQGATISPLLSNIYLHPFDEEMKKRGHTLVRYADNFILLEKTRGDATAALNDGEEFLKKELSLVLNTDSRAIRSVHEGFVFLGFLFKDEERTIAQSKLQKMRNKMASVLKNSSGLSDAVDRINESIAAWRRYYGGADVEEQFQYLDNVLFDEIEDFLARRGVYSQDKSVRQALQRLEFFCLKDAKEKRNLASLLIAATGSKKRQKVDETRSFRPVAQQVALRRRKYEKVLSEASNLVISTPGSFIGKTSRRVVVRERGRRVRELPFIRLRNILIISRGVSLSGDLVRLCAEGGVPITFFDPLGKPFAQVFSPRSPCYSLSLAQSEATTNKRGVHLAKSFVIGKIRNQINLIKYYRKYKDRREFDFFEACEESIGAMQTLLVKVRDTAKRDRIDDITPNLFALEGQAASYYWKLIKLLLSHDVYFQGRERKGATDLVNSLLNYGYGILYSQIYQAIILAGLNPNISFLHKEQPGKPTLVFDIIEEFRQPIVDRAIIGMIRKKEKLVLDGTNLTQETKSKIVEAVMKRLSIRLTFRGRRLSLREIISHQAQALAEFLEGKGTYHPYIAKW